MNILDKYKLVVQDEYNLKLSEVVPKKAAFGKEPENGETSEKFIGYFSTLSGAIKKILNLELKKMSDTQVLENIVKDISSLESCIELRFGNRETVLSNLNSEL